VSFDFPPDLIELQQKWFAVDRDRTAAARVGDNEAFEAAGARLQELTIELQKRVRAYEQPFQARMALREAAAEHPDG
jgi:hypothetical protein